MDNIFIQLAIILGLASFLGFFTLKFKLPILIAYLLGGLLIATLSLFDPHTSKALSFLPEIGLAFVLFLVGMELDFRELRKLGKPIILAGTVQIFITTIIGSVLARNLGFAVTESWYLGIGLSFSSTIVVIKLLIDKKDLTSLYGKLTVGILLLEDLIAVCLLLFLTVSPSMFHLGIQQSFPLLAFLAKVLLLFTTAIILNKFLLVFIFKAVSKSGELLFLTALSWCFIYVSFAILMGFSVVIGAFLAGMVLASSPYHFQIQGKIKPLRDFFVALFFVYLGTQVNFTDLGAAYPLILVFTGYSLFLKPLLFLLILGAFGFRKHTMFQASISLTHISEFSLIILLVGFKLGTVSQTALTAIALSTVLSMVAASLMIHHSGRIYKKISRLVAFFERKQGSFELEKTADKLESENHVVVIGAHRVGGEVVKFLKKEKIPQLVVDFNPERIKTLTEMGINCVYGDMGDPEILEALSLENAKMIISTAQDREDNLLLLEELRSRHIGVPVVTRAETLDDAKVLYQKGASYVIVPEVLAGDTLTELLKNHLGNNNYFKEKAKSEKEKLDGKTLAWE